MEPFPLFVKQLSFLLREFPLCPLSVHLSGVFVIPIYIEEGTSFAQRKAFCVQLGGARPLLSYDRLRIQRE